MGLKFRASNGKTYDFPDDKTAEQFMQWADGKGLKYEGLDEPDSEPDGDVDDGQGAPRGHVIEMPAQRIEGDPNALDPEQPVDDTPEWIKGLVGAGAGLAHGVTSGLPALAPGEYGANFRGNIANAQRDAPISYRVGDLVGSVANPINWIGGGVGGAILKGATQAGVTSYADSEGSGQSQTDRAIAALEAAGIGGGVGGFLGGLGAGATGTGKALGSAATKARGAAYGVTDDMVSNQASRMGGASADEALEALVREGERIAPPNMLKPIGSGTYAKRFGAEANRLNGAIDQDLLAAQRAGAQLPADPRAEVAVGLNKRAWNAAGGGYTADEAPALRRVADNVLAGPQVGDPLAARAQKIGFDQAAKYGTDGSPSSAYAAQANKAAADEYRGMLRDYANQGSPEIGASYAANNAAYPVAADLARGSADRAASAATSGGWAVPALGAGVGALAGGLPGAAAGAAAGAMARNAVGGIAPDLAANIARTGSNFFQATGNALNASAQVAPGIISGSGWISQQLPNATAVAGIYDAQSQTGQSPDQQTSPPAAPEPDPTKRYGSQPSDTRVKPFDNARGYAIGRGLSALMDEDEQRQAIGQPMLLQPYAAALAPNGDDTTEEERTAAIERLARTDAYFRRAIYPRLLVGSSK